MTMRLKISTKRILLCLFVISPVLYVTACNLISERRANAFAIINTGDAREVVLAHFGLPSQIERHGIMFTRYASQQCQNPCVERLWFENRLTLDMEAWSVTLDSHGKVIEKTHWVSP